MYKTLAEIETRKAAILQEMEQEGADLDALKNEMEELRKNADELREAARKAEETRKAIAEGAKGVVVLETRKAETASKTVDEIRGSAEYAEAFKNYILLNFPEYGKDLKKPVSACRIGIPIISGTGSNRMVFEQVYQILNPFRDRYLPIFEYCSCQRRERSFTVITVIAFNAIPVFAVRYDLLRSTATAGGYLDRIDQRDFLC